MKKKVHAAVAIVYGNLDDIKDGNKAKVLLSKRRDGQVYSGYWEFPGGKLEPGESPKLAVIREMKEELSIDVTNPLYLGEVVYEYPEFDVFLYVFRITEYAGNIIGNEGQELHWESLNKLSSIEPILPASFEIIKLI